MRRRAISVFLALLVVSSGFAAPVAAANSLPEGCSGIDNFIHDLLTFQNVNENPDNPCSTQNKVNSAIEDMQESDANQTEVDIYQAAAAEKGNGETFGSVYNNYLQDTESAAWMKMQVAVAEAYQNGSTQSEAKVQAKNAIADYYAVKQVNLVERWDASLANFRYLQDSAINESGIANDFVWYDYTQEDQDHTTGSPNQGVLETHSVSLVNGSSHTADRIYFDFEAGSGRAVDGRYSITNNYVDADNGAEGMYIHSLMVREPSSGAITEPLYFHHYEDYNGPFTEIETKVNNLQSEADTFVEATYADFDSGEINASDVISANTAMFEYGVREANESESLYNSVGALSMMGYDTPNVSSTGTMDVTYDGNTYTGIVMAQSAPNGSWSTETTYNTSNITGPVFMATSDGNKVDFAENTEFTIDQMRARDGSNTSSVETTKYVYKTSNTSETVELQQQLTDLRKEIEDREQGIGGGGAGGAFGTETIIAVAALAGAALLFGRSDQ
jgi:hypothetical protein